MRFPNKVISFKESVLANFAPILKLLKIRDYDVISLYHEFDKKMTPSEFINTLDCLFALNKIRLENGVIHYVNGNPM